MIVHGHVVTRTSCSDISVCVCVCVCACVCVKMCACVCVFISRNTVTSVWLFLVQINTVQVLTEIISHFILLVHTVIYNYMQLHAVTYHPFTSMRL